MFPTILLFGIESQNYSFAASGGGLFNGSALVNKLSTMPVISSGVYADGDAAVSIQSSVANIVGSGVYADGDAAVSIQSSVANIVGSGGALGASTATTVATYTPNTSSTGILLAGEDAELPETFVRPRPVITFAVRLIDWQSIFSYPQPDSWDNITFLKQSLSIEIPGVPQPLHDGDQFILFGQQALEVRSAYAPYLTVLSQQ